MQVLQEEMQLHEQQCKDVQAKLVTAQRQLQAAADKEELANLEQQQKHNNNNTASTAHLQGGIGSVSDATTEGASALSSSEVQTLHLQQRVKELEAVVEDSQKREKKLQGEMRKKSEMARQVVSAQEKEVKRLKAKLQQMLSQNGAGSENTASPGGAVTPDSSISSCGSSGGTVRWGTPLAAEATVATAATSSARPARSNAGADASAGVGAGAGAGAGADKDYRQSAVVERETYLRQAFYGLFCANDAKDMQHLNRVVCTILQLDSLQCKEVSARIDLLAEAVRSAQTMESLSGTFSDVGSSVASGISSLSTYWTTR